MNEILDKLFEAADNHGEDTGEPDHTVGDLQDLLRQAWDLLPVADRICFLGSETVGNLIEAGAREAFTVNSLVSDLTRQLGEMEAEIAAAGYRIESGLGAFFWENSGTDEAGEDFYARDDAVADAHRHLVESRTRPEANPAPQP